MRFQAPARTDVPAVRFDHPLYADFVRYRPLLLGPVWPSLDGLNAHWAERTHRYSGQTMSFVPQTPALLADGLHYEARTHARGTIATRPECWHDLFNALMWLERFPLKCAVNATYVREFGRPTSEPRTRAQCALTHFDEAGAVVVLEDPALLACWDRHDWAGLFAGDAWARGARLYLFGHALLEQGLVPRSLPVAKCLVVTGSVQLPVHSLFETLADAIVDGDLLCDPKALRPLPLAGLAGWHPAHEEPGFFDHTPCFRPLRPGRRYPAPSSLADRAAALTVPATGDLRLTGAAR